MNEFQLISLHISRLEDEAWEGEVDLVPTPQNGFNGCGSADIKIHVYGICFDDVKVLLNRNLQVFKISV